MSITVEFYDKFKPIYKDRNYLGTNNSPVIEDVELNTKLNKEQYEYNNYNEFKNDLKNNNKNIKKYLRNNKYYVKITFGDGSTYEGQIDEKGNFEGIGKNVANEEGGEETYIGDWKKNKQDGNGVFTWLLDGTTYEGEWKEGLKDGYGIMKHNYYNYNYQGYWKKNLKDGKGKIEYNNGNKYEGEWKEDLKDGYGVFTWLNTQKYQGYWKKDQQEGKGVMEYSDGTKYEGDWKKGLLDGNGVFTWKDGHKYIGKWEKDNMIGIGAVCYTKDNNNNILLTCDKENNNVLSITGSNNKIYNCSKELNINININDSQLQYPTVREDNSSDETFESFEDFSSFIIDDNNTKAITTADGEKTTCYFSNGVMYEGSLQDGLFNGQGKLTWLDGTTYEGTFTQGKCSTGEVTTYDKENNNKEGKSKTSMKIEQEKINKIEEPKPLYFEIPMIRKTISWFGGCDCSIADMKEINITHENNNYY